MLTSLRTQCTFSFINPRCLLEATYKGFLLFSQEKELAEVAALQYYVEYGRDMSKGRLMDLLGSYIPDMYLETARGPEKWAHLIEDEFKKVSLPLETIVRGVFII